MPVHTAVDDGFPLAAMTKHVFIDTADLPWIEPSYRCPIYTLCVRNNNPTNFASNTKILHTFNHKKSLTRYSCFYFSYFLPIFEFQACNLFSQPLLSTTSIDTLAHHLDGFDNVFNVNSYHAPVRDPTHEAM